MARTIQRTDSAAKTLLGAVGSILVAELVGALGAVATASSVATWYASLERPWFTPPNWLFGPAWTTLYALMGIAAYLVWRRGWHRGAVKIALAVYAGQLVLNGLWSPAFFGLQSPALGFVVILALWGAIAATIVWFARVSRAAAWLMVPYLLWVSYATALNFEILRLN